MYVTGMIRFYKKQRGFVLALNGLLFIFLPAFSLSANTLDSASGITHAITANKNVSAHEIKLRFHGARLSDAMADVSRRSKVWILISPDLKNEKINAEVKSADWRSAIKSLLTAY